MKAAMSAGPPEPGLQFLVSGTRRFPCGDFPDLDAGSILVLGHSHVAAIRHAAVRRREAGGLPYMVRTINVMDPRFGDPTSLKLSGDFIPREVLAETKRIIAKRQPLVCTALGGNAHTMIALARWDQPWDFRLPGEDHLPLDPLARIIPASEAHDMLTITMADELGALARLRDEIGPFRQIESPPPVASTRFIAANIEPYFIDKPEYNRNGISPLGLRYRMWRLSCRIFEDHCRALGCGYVRLPNAVFDDLGCLDQKLAGNATHGNIEFGQHVIEHLDEMVRIDLDRRMSPSRRQ